MILFIGVIATALVAGWVMGGDIRRFAELRLRWWLLAPVGLALQGVPLPNGRHGTDLMIRVVVFGVSYVLVLAFAIRNWRIAGVPLIIGGLLMNGLVVTANGGMPVSGSALVTSDQPEVLRLLREDEGAKHHLLDENDLLTLLGDVVPIPAPVHQVISVGDVLVYAGLIWLIIAVMRGRTPGLDRSDETLRYRGRHRKRMRREGPTQVASPAAAMKSGNGP